MKKLIFIILLVIMIVISIKAATGEEWVRNKFHCSNFYGGSDTDFCVDAEGAGGTDTNASTECNAGEYLDGSGLCIHLNDTIDAKLSTKIYFPNTTYTKYGTNLSANITEMWYYNDGSYNITETAGANALEVYINFTDVVNFTAIVTREYYVGSASHHVKIQLWDYDDGVWEDYTDFVGQEGFNIEDLAVLDPSEHLNNSLVQLRFYHVQNGVGSHELKLDYVQLQDGISVTSSTSLAGYAKYDFGYNDFDGNGYFNTTDNITAAYFKGDGSLLTGISSGNVTWNQSHADSLYVNKSGDTMTGQLVVDTSLTIGTNDNLNTDFVLYGDNASISGTAQRIADFRNSDGSKGFRLGFDTKGQYGVIAPVGANSGLSFWTHNGAWGERFRVQTDGKINLSEDLISTANIGLGKNDPDVPLMIYDAGAQISGVAYRVADFRDAAGTKGFRMGYDSGETLGVLSSIGANSGTAFWTHDGSWGERMRIHTNGLVGINDETPANAPLAVKADSGHDNIQLEENSGSEAWQIGVDAAGDLNFEDSGGTAVTFEDGIPGFLLDRTDATNSFHLQNYYPGLTYFSQNYFRHDNGTWDLDDQDDGAAGMIIDARENFNRGLIRFFTSNKSIPVDATNIIRMSIDTTGNVGINTTTPTERLHVVAAPNSNNLQLDEYNGGEHWKIGVDSDGDLNFKDESTTRINFQDGGYVGIGTSSPLAQLNVIGTANADLRDRGMLFEIYDSGASWRGMTIISADGSEASPAGLVAGEQLGTIMFGGYDGTKWRVPATISAEATGVSNNANIAGSLEFWTGTVTGDASAGSATGIARRMLISAGGEVEINSVSGDGTGSVVCIKSDGNLGTCSDQPDSNGDCTCG